MNIHKLYIVLTLVFCTQISYGQKFSNLVSSFSIIEKIINEDESTKSTITSGKLDYSLERNEIIFDITFPQKGQWHFIDSTMIVSKVDTTYKIQMKNEVSLQSLFESILTDHSNDYNLPKHGFEIRDITRVDGGQVFIDWRPPTNYKKFLKSVSTKLDNGRLTGLVMIDTEGLTINKTFFSKFNEIKGITIPGEITSQFETSTGQKVLRKIILRNVEIY